MNLGTRAAAAAAIALVVTGSFSASLAARRAEQGSASTVIQFLNGGYGPRVENVVVAANHQNESLFSAWINVFSVPQFVIESVDNDVVTTGTGQHRMQKIRGTHNGASLYFDLQRSEIGFSPSFRKKNIIKYFGLEEEDTDDFRKIKVRRGRGVWLVHKGCRFVRVGIRGNPTGDGVDNFEIIMNGYTCNSAFQLGEFLQQVRLATLESNRTDFALRRAPSESQPQAPTMSRDRLACEFAGNDSSRLAGFMQDLKRDQLVRFLDADRDCRIF